MQRQGAYALQHSLGHLPLFLLTLMLSRVFALIKTIRNQNMYLYLLLFSCYHPRDTMRMPPKDSGKASGNAASRIVNSAICKVMNVGQSQSTTLARNLLDGTASLLASVAHGSICTL
eukprot:TRINITY_DN2676_c1_g1::TRINITY_DN2676_c1_g1_i2::g.25953::m.25953 TRINITY_DN2676_c1_g1::TRINITY_DN2676_c1_g1_i2::g.25953  ORF type:complete len:117 (-),score=0.54,Sec23_helical/PF04815.10/0.94,Sec23_helical/PF04815.10/4.4e+02 TRINITY_DN2676_c1_g1_i2:291-641(-)